MPKVYIDESGDIGPTTGSRTLVVAAMIADDHTCRALELHVKRLKKSLKRKKGADWTTELKAAQATAGTRRKLLQAITAEEISIVAVILDKREAKHEPRHRENLYMETVALVARQCAMRWTQVRLILHKRYTTQGLRSRLDDTIRRSLDVLGSEHTPIQQARLSEDLCLYVADHVAWAIGHKYETGDPEYYDLLKGKIVSELVIPIPK